MGSIKLARRGRDERGMKRDDGTATTARNKEERRPRLPVFLQELLKFSHDGRIFPGLSITCPMGFLWEFFCLSGEFYPRGVPRRRLVTSRGEPCCTSSLWREAVNQRIRTYHASCFVYRSFDEFARLVASGSCWGRKN